MDKLTGFNSEVLLSAYIPSQRITVIIATSKPNESRDRWITRFRKKATHFVHLHSVKIASLDS